MDVCEKERKIYFNYTQIIWKLFGIREFPYFHAKKFLASSVKETPFKS